MSSKKRIVRVSKVSAKQLEQLQALGFVVIIAG